MLKRYFGIEKNDPQIALLKKDLKKQLEDAIKMYNYHLDRMKYYDLLEDSLSRTIKSLDNVTKDIEMEQEGY